MFQHHLLLGLLEGVRGEELVVGVHLVQVLAGDGGLVDHLAAHGLQRGHQTEGVLLQEPLGLILQVDVDRVVPGEVDDTI